MNTLSILVQSLEMILLILILILLILVTVQLFHNLKGGMIPNLLCELKKMLATQMQMKRQELQFVICQTETDVNPRIPVFVFCINASRLGTDAASAIQNLKGR